MAHNSWSPVDPHLKVVMLQANHSTVFAFFANESELQQLKYFGEFFGADKQRWAESWCEVVDGVCR
jgi:hypothetical protein